MKRLIIWAGALFLLSILPLVALGQTTWSAPKNLWPDSLKSIGMWDLLVAENGNIFVATVATQGIGVGPAYRSTDDGRTWVNLFKNGANGLASDIGFGVFQDPKTKAILLGTWNGVFRSADNGETWRQSSAPFPYPKWKPVGRFATDKKTGIILAGTNDGIIASRDGGNVWFTAFHYDSATATKGFAVMDICVAPNGTVYAATTGGATGTHYGVLRSDGTVWEWKNNGLTNLSMYSVACDDAGTVYAGSEDGLFRSTDNGESWRKIGFEKNAIADILIVRPDLIFIANGPNGAPPGVFRYDGLSWSQIGPPPAGGDCLARIGNGILIGAFGVYLAADVITAVEGPPPSPPANFRLEQNFPNPFNPATTIRYSVPKTGVVNIAVYNLLGQEIKTLVNEEKRPGEYEVRFDTSRLPSGIYFYRLNAGTFTETKKMLLVK